MLTLLFHPQPSNNIIYLNLGFDFAHLPQNLQIYLPLFLTLLERVGTKKYDFVDLQEQLSLYTGGLNHSFLVATSVSNQVVARAFVNLKFLAVNTDKALELIEQILLHPNWQNQTTIKQTATEMQAQIKNRLVPEGHRFVSMYLEQNSNKAGIVRQNLFGLNQFNFLTELLPKIEQNWSQVHSDLLQLVQWLSDKSNLLLNVTGNQNHCFELETKLQKLVNKFENGNQSSPENKQLKLAEIKPINLIKANSNVNYVGKGAKIFNSTHDFNGSQLVILNYLRTSYLWQNVRVQGGAYGAMINFNKFTGFLSFLSYRDPNTELTLQSYDNAVSLLENISLTEEEIAKFIIGTIGDFDLHLLPHEKGYQSMIDFLLENKPELIKQAREQILATKNKDFCAFANFLYEFKKNGKIAILGGEEKLQTFAAKHDPQLINNLQIKD